MQTARILGYAAGSGIGNMQRSERKPFAERFPLGVDSLSNGDVAETFTLLSCSPFLPSVCPDYSACPGQRQTTVWGA